MNLNVANMCQKFFKCQNHCKIFLSLFKVNLNVANMVLMCKIGVKYHHSSQGAAVMHLFWGNNQGVHLLEHVC